MSCFVYFFNILLIVYKQKPPYNYCEERTYFLRTGDLIMAHKFNLMFKAAIFLLLTTISGCGSAEKDISIPPINSESNAGPVSSKPKDSTHLVTFDSNGGSQVQSQTVEHSYKATKPENPTRPGYDFVNWTYQGEEWSFIGYSVTEDMTLFANWNIITYSISYNLNGGINSPDNPTEYTVEDTLPLRPATKTGYTFVTWKLNDQSVEAISKGTTGNITLVAVFSVHSHQVTVSSSDTKMGTVAGSGTFNYGSQVTVTATPNSGYRFTGWYKNDYQESSDSSYSFTMPDKIVSLEARWETITYRISYTLNGGTNSSDNPTTYTVEDELPLYPATKTGYTFVTWKLNGEPVETISKGTVGNITLVAEFYVHSHELVVTSNDDTKGTVTGGGTYDYGTRVTITATPNEGYSFSGWYRNGKNVATTRTCSFNMPDRDDTYEARWSIINYTITYNLDDGSNSYSNPSKYTIESEITLLPATKTGYTFLGWKLDNQYVDTISKGSTGDITLYAVFSINSHEVMVTSNNQTRGTVTGGGTYDYGSQVTVTATPNNGYRFSGWYRNNYRYSTETSYSFKMYDSDVVVEAKWDIITYTVSYNLDGGTNSSNNPAQYTVEDEFVLESPTRFGYHFSGWLLNNQVVEKIEKGTFGNITLTASWEVVSGYENIDDFSYEITEDGITITGLVNRNKTNIVIPTCVTKIADGAFNDWSSSVSSVTSIVVPDSVTYIGESAFSGCSSLKSITLPFIGNRPQGGVGQLIYIFGGELPSSLEEVIVNDCCTSIYSGAFYWCKTLKRITFGANFVVNDDYGSENKYPYLAECPSLESITISENHPYLKSIDGILYDKNVSKLLFVPVGYKGDVTLPNTIKAIPNEAFYDRASITSITIPEGVVSIGHEAFSGCSSLEHLSLPNSISSIGSRAFPGCRFFVGIDGQTNSVIELHCKDENSPLLYNEYDGCYYLGNDENPYLVLVKSDYDSLTNCVVHNGCKILVDTSFEFAQNLVSLSVPDSVIYINSSSFSYCNSLISINYYGSINNWLNMQGKNGFKGDIHLYLNNSEEETKNVVIDGVTSIDDYCFAKCSSLTSVTISEGVTSIGDYAFSNCTSLTSINIPDGVTSIDFGAFNNCTSLTSINIPSGLESINNYLFKNCSSLESLILPDGLTSIESFAFTGCSSLEYNEYDNALYLGNAQNPYMYLIKAKNEEITSCSINENCKVISNDAFSNCASLSSLTIPEGVISIGVSAFYKCTALTTVSIPTSVTSINSGAFGDCLNLSSVTLPNGLTSIGYGAFSGCASLSAISIPSSVTSIGARAFADCTSLHSLSIPSSVTSIGGHAFANCTSLEYNEYDNALYLGNAQNPCLYLTEVKNTDIESCVINENCKIINDYAFQDCTSLSSISIPSGVISIGSYAFFNCSSLETISIPNSVETLGSYAFSSCSSLEFNEYDNALYLGNSENPYLCLYKAKDRDIDSCIINENCKIIYDSAFNGCYDLETIAIPDGVISIGQYAFYGCLNLQSVTIPASVKFIGGAAFDNNLISINVFYKGSIDDLMTIEEYLSGAYLSVSYFYFYSENEPASDGNYWHYVDGVPTIW